MQKFNIINFDDELNDMNKEIVKSTNNINKEILNEYEIENELNELLERVQNLARKSNIELENINPLNKNLEIFNLTLDEYLVENSNILNEKTIKFPKLNNVDVIVCSISSILSVLIDVIFVGTPEIVKIYRGGEIFDGSILTAMLRKIGNNPNTQVALILQWFSDKCKVPYDISAYKNTITPNNHRLRSFAHDPLFGLLFAIADIILGTTTCIDNSGKVKILVNKRKAPTIEKYLAIIYYFGHLISDICTARGLPIPGFCFMEFFQTEINNKSIAKIVEDMYLDGYDFRHMISMGIPIFINEIIIKIYSDLTKEIPNVISTISEKEKIKLDNKLKKEKMKFIANTSATLGNAIKFISPPNCGNPTAINLVQWVNFLQSGMAIVKSELRDISVEQAIDFRKSIDKKWKELFEDLH